MKKYIIGRILFVIPIMLILSFFTFSLTYLSPSDPVTLKYERMGAVPDREQLEKVKDEMGLNDPFLVQYARWLGRVLQGDLGESYYYSTSVWYQISRRIPNTLLLTAATLVLTVLFAVPLGVLCASRQNKWVDYLFRFISFFGVSMPSFWLGLILLYIFGLKLGWFPIASSTITAKGIVLPALTLSIYQSTKYVRQVRTVILDELHQDYVIGARARGLSESAILWKHVLPNAVLPLITLLGMSIGWLLGGVAVIEIVFSWPGIGNMAVRAIMMRDYLLIEGFVLWIAIVYMFINFLVDLSYTWLDPKLRKGEQH